MRLIYKIYFFLLVCWIIPNLYAQTQTVDLTVAYKEVSFANKKVMAIAVNGQIPGPTLHFQEGDDVIIRVHNHLKVGTAVHWHGLLVPWRMDGVEHVTQEPIAPQGQFIYHFKIKQSGTYWYHAHADLQEQQGLYGALIIDPKTPSPYHYSKDFPIVLSDWSNANPDTIYNNLKKGNGRPAVLQPTLLQFFKDLSGKPKAEKAAVWKAYWGMQTARMSVYDLSDVQYDAFLLNGKTQREPWQQFVKVGDTVRLRLIGAGASTVFKIKISDAPLKVVEVQGNDIKPFEVKDITLAPGQTMDVLLNIKEKKPYIIYAESIDASGYAVGILNPTATPITSIPAVTPFPAPKPMAMAPMDESQPMAHSMSMNSDMSMNQNSAMMQHDMSAMDKDMVMDMNNKTMAMPEDNDESQQWQALKPTNDPNKPVTVLTMRLGGYMGRYVWFINGLPEYLAKPILIEPGKRYRFVFINETMMHHPMHLHGHWMVLRNGHGAYDPLVHTIDVAPFQTVTADFDADAGSGWWYFHCHNLYHMKAGMARLLHYDTPDDAPSDTNIKDNTAPAPYTMTKTSDTPVTTEAEAMPKTAHPATMVMTNDWQYAHDFARNVDQFTATTMYGGDYNKIQLYTNQAQFTRGTLTYADVDIFAWHMLNNFWAIKGGANYSYKPTAYWQPGAGIEATLPFFIGANIRTYWHDGSGQINAIFSRNISLTGNWTLLTSVEAIAATKSLDYAQIGQGFNSIQYTVGPSYQLLSGLDLQLQYQYTRKYGDTASILKADGQGPTSSLLTLGFEAVF